MEKKPALVAAGVVVSRYNESGEREVLGFVRFRDANERGFPCGKLEPGETPAEAAVRETYEETGLWVELHGDPYIVWDGDTKVLLFRAEVTSGQLRGNVPGEGIPGWMPPHELTYGRYGELNADALQHFGVSLKAA